MTKENGTKPMGIGNQKMKSGVCEGSLAL